MVVLERRRNWRHAQVAGAAAAQRVPHANPGGRGTSRVGVQLTLGHTGGSLPTAKQIDRWVSVSRTRGM